jgi:hypothetical protein
MEILFENYEKLNIKEILLFDTLKHLFLTYLYQPRIKPIDIQILSEDFKKMNTIFESFGQDKKKNEKMDSKKTSLENKSKVTGFSPILRSTKKKRLQIKKNRTKRNSYLLFADLKKNKKSKKNKK